MSNVQPLKTLHGALITVIFEKMILHFEPNLIVGKTLTYFEDKVITIKVSPPKLQDKNCLAKRYQKTIVFMATKWMRDVLLPKNIGGFQYAVPAT